MQMAKGKRAKELLILICCNLLLLSTSRISAQVDGQFFLSADTLAKHKQIWLTENWKYHPGDPSEGDLWAAPEFDDSAWETAATWLSPRRLPKSGWDGLGWFRLHLKIDSTLWQTPLAILMFQHGASEIYLDGRRIFILGKVGTSISEEQGRFDRDPKFLPIGKENHHVLAVRYSNYSAVTLASLGRATGFVVQMGELHVLIAQRSAAIRFDTVYQILGAVVPLAFTVLHLALFLFYPRARGHLFFALFTAALAALLFFDLQEAFLNDPAQFLLAERLPLLAGIVMLLSSIRFTHSLYYSKLPVWFWIFGLAGLGVGLWVWRDPFRENDYSWIFVLLCLAETVRVLGLAILKKKEGVWIIGIGFGAFIVTVLYVMLRNRGVLPQIEGLDYSVLYGVFALLVSMSLYLSRSYAQTNKHLEKKLVEVQELSEKTLAQERQAQELNMQRKLLEAENARKTKELEEARQLQLSMLPQSIPALPNLEIGVYTKPATEVGGDYYDFHLHDDGTLTVAIGDATGHGMKAGTVVTAAKSLFHALAQEGDGPKIFQKFTRTLKGMNLGRLYMAMTLIKFKDNKINIAAAGMPPALIYRAATKEVEEINIKAMPLGSFSGFPYRQEELELHTGDAIVLMSDGLPEMFNHQGEILDYPGAKKLFEDVADRSPQEIISHLIESGEAWANGHPQEDDVTFVVMKVKS